jgi:peroxiredoxin
MEQMLVIGMVLLWVVVLCNFVITLALARNMQSKAAALRPLVPGQPAPTFAAETAAGGHVTLADYAGRAMVLLFVSPDCAPCRMAVPDYEALAPLAARQGVALALVSLADAARTRAFVAEVGTRLPTLVAPPESNPLKDAYKIQGTPTYCLIDAQGVVQGGGYPNRAQGSWQALVEGWEAAEQAPASMPKAATAS